MHQLNNIILSTDKDNLKELPNTYLEDSLFLTFYFSKKRHLTELDYISQDKIKEIAAYTLIANPDFFFNFPKELQTITNLEITLSSCFYSKTNLYSCLEYLATLNKQQIFEILEESHSYIDFSWDTNIYQQYFEQFKHSDHYIKGYCKALIAKNQPFPSSLWMSRDVDWWVQHREYFSHNILFPNFSITNKYYYDFNAIPAKFLDNPYFALTLVSNSYEMIEKISSISLNEDNSLKIIGTYLYYQEYEKFPPLSFYETKDASQSLSSILNEKNSNYINLVQNFIFDNEQSDFYISCSDKILSNIKKQQLYISNLLSPFFKIFTHEEIDKHFYWNHSSFNHIALLTNTESPSFEFIKSFNNTLKIDLLLKKIKPLLVNNIQYNIHFYSKQKEPTNLVKYIFQESIIDGDTLANQFQISFQKQSEEYVFECYELYLRPLIEADYLEYIIPSNDNSKTLKAPKF